jgi:hypothetical protein
MPIPVFNSTLKYKLRAHLRDLQVLLVISQGSLGVFTAIVLSNALLLYNLYTFPGTNDYPCLSQVISHYV